MIAEKTEREWIDQVQNGLGAIKEGLIAIEQINSAAGRKQAANAAMGFHGRVLVQHERMTEAPERHYPEFSDDVIAQGGGGR